MDEKTAFVAEANTKSPFASALNGQLSFSLKQ
jgi:hypothetical protein